MYLQHARLLCPSLCPRVCSNSCPFSQWCYLTISSSATPFLLPPSIFPSIRIFSNAVLPIRWPKYWSFNCSISPSNEYSRWFPLGLSDLISLLSKGLYHTKKVKVKVTQSCLDSLQLLGLYSPWNSQARMPEWVAFPFSRGSSQPRDRTQVSCIADGFFTSWAWEVK